jgi:uncharacterized protein with HEPN domain
MSRDNGLYLDDVIDALTAIQSYSKGLDQITFLQDQKTIDACIRRFQIVGEAVKKFPEEWKQTEPTIPWPRISGLRNMLVHEYFRIDDEALWKAIQQDLNPLLAACQRIQDRIEKS